MEWTCGCICGIILSIYFNHTVSQLNMPIVSCGLKVHVEVILIDLNFISVDVLRYRGAGGSAAPARRAAAGFGPGCAAAPVGRAHVEASHSAGEGAQTRSEHHLQQQHW